MFVYPGQAMASTSLSFAVPDDPDLIARLATRLAIDGDPPVSFRRSSSAVLAFESQTSEMMLRSRLIQGMTDAAGPDWQAFVRPVG
jgi:hypothetical protein